MTQNDELDVFEERAENLSDEDFLAWTAPTPHEERVLRQLTSSGPKLLTGPRGCGKTTLLRLAAIKLAEGNRFLPVTVNFGRSIFIEPAFVQRSDADGFFQDWLVAKIISAAAEALDTRVGGQISNELLQRARSFVQKSEGDTGVERTDLPGPQALSVKLAQWAHAAGLSGVVLLLDDAAHAFVPEQQRIFFELLRGIRSKDVTYKAAIYPGVTEFSPNFHVGHDAKIVRAWIPVEGKSYLDFMRTAYERRLPDDVRPTIPEGTVDFFAAASFGLPRAFFGMLEAYLDARTPSTGKSSRVPLSVVSEHSDSLRVLHRSLSAKLPRYGAYVDTGETVLDHALTKIRELNSKRPSGSGGESAIDLAVRLPVDPKLDTIFSLLEYAGLIRRTHESVSMGPATYTKFAIHGALLVASNALKYGQNPTLDERVDALIRGSRTGTFSRVSSTDLLDPASAEACQLLVGSCSNCGAPRATEAARFCSNCGSELVDASLLEELLRSDIDVLPLTPKKRSSLRAIGITTVETIVRDRGAGDLSKAKGVGRVWARRIRSVAEEFVSV